MTMNKKTKEQKNKRTNIPIDRLFIFLFFCFFVSLFFGFSVKPARVLAADFDRNNLISDGAFTNLDAMSTANIQSFLENKASFLKDYSENGRSASQIIADAAHGSGEASGSINGIDINTTTGTVNPQVILVTLQKEQSLITKTERDDEALRKAMGYACPDGGSCNPNYAGFTKQVENAAWQLRYNYERAQGRGFSDYQVGQTMNFSNSGGYPNMDVTFANRATASLYRYTPHTYNGNYNFWYYFDKWFVQKEYQGTWQGQSANPTLLPGQTATLSVTFKNTGTSNWSATGANPVRLALDKYQDENLMKKFNQGWLAEYRLANLNQSSVPSGESATFSFTIRVPDDLGPGSYRFYVRMVAENYAWFADPDTNGGAWWEIKVPKPSANWVSQSGTVTAWPGEVVDLSVTFLNTQAASWTNYSHSTNLAIDKYQDEALLSKFQHSSWLSANRIARLSQTELTAGSSATYSFQIKIPADLSAGSYRFYVRLVQEGFAWFDNPDTNGGAWWEINIPRPTAEYVSQSEYPTLMRGDAQVMWVKFKNTSNKTWRADDPHPVRLAIDKYWADKTAWQGPGWISENRLVRAQEGEVPPGGIGTYRFNIFVPQDMPSGQHKFYVRLVAEHFSWFDNPDTNGAAWWGITVN